ncbi:hypothetical protein [Vibrio sonorensis]|uniref:hypothetical protein n=1 Tax=Vibrio sonorensis TaxID=1004316 RepID=UPI001FE1623A|nr:hypothetical protein [Vibrio sonorensis]
MLLILTVAVFTLPTAVLLRKRVQPSPEQKQEFPSVVKALKNPTVLLGLALTFVSYWALEVCYQ